MRDAAWPLPAAPGFNSWPLPPMDRPAGRMSGRKRHHARSAHQNDEEFEATKAFVRKWGPGMVLGCLAVHFTKRLIRKIPIVGLVTRPVLDLFPTLLVGPALGAAVTYGIVHGDGDLLAARRPVMEGVGAVSKELEGRVRELQRGLDERRPYIESNIRQLEADSRQLVGSLEGVVDGLQRDITPVLERRSREARDQLDALRTDWSRR